ncbi:hypothetical protein [Dokdonella sp.]|uniref:hypothetical protein n=1 Tax=Dokdonella sp. TaxID=2291710 RepID=UPI003C33D836
MFCNQVDPLDSSPALSEFAYLAVLLWLGVADPGSVSIDFVLQRSANRQGK